MKQLEKIQEDALKLCWTIENLAASPDQTILSLLASDLYQDIRKYRELVERQFAPG